MEIATPSDSSITGTISFLQNGQTGTVSDTGSGAISSRSIDTGNPRYGGRYYGNWCGPGWSGGRDGAAGTGVPVDDLDQQCQYHDRAYAAADDYWGPLYAAAETTSAQNEACASWRGVYWSVDGVLTRAVRGLPELAGTVHHSRPDGWNYDPAVFGTHPLTTGERINYRDLVILAGNLGFFNDPPCSLVTGPYDGQWSGETPDGAILTFTVTGVEITGLQFRFPERNERTCRVGGLTINVRFPVAITGNSFSILPRELGTSDGSFSATYSWTGMFTMFPSSNAASGVLELTTRESRPGACSSSTLRTSWAARRNVGS